MDRHGISLEIDRRKKKRLIWRQTRSKFNKTDSSARLNQNHETPIADLDPSLFRFQRTQALRISGH
jgi:hypothetical protein